MSKRLAVDWDGTLCEDSWPGWGGWMPGSVQALHKLLEAGYDITVHSCRIGPTFPDGVTLRPPGQAEAERRIMREILDAQGLREVRIYDPSMGKPSADHYIDNKAIHYNGRPGAWNAITERLLLAAGKEVE